MLNNAKKLPLPFRNVPNRQLASACWHSQRQAEVGVEGRLSIRPNLSGPDGRNSSTVKEIKLMF
jgi:hypothetical protein